MTNDIKFLILDEIVLSEEADSDGLIPASIEEWGSGIPIELDLWASGRGIKSISHKILDKMVAAGIITIHEDDNDNREDKVVLTDKGLSTWRKMRKARSLATEMNDYESPQPTPKPQPTKETMKKPEDMTSAELVESYNKLADKPVKKFSSKSNGIKRLKEIMANDKPKEAPKKATGGSQKFALKDGHTLHKLLDHNPRREGTHGHESWNAFNSGMTYLEAIDAGARNRDLRWDILHGRIEIRDKDGTPVKIDKDQKP